MAALEPSDVETTAQIDALADQRSAAARRPASDMSADAIMARSVDMTHRGCSA
jgi:hypothetical protein